MLYSYNGKNITYSSSPYILFNIIGYNIQYFIKFTDGTGKSDFYIIRNTNNFYFDYGNPVASKYTFNRLSKNSNYKLQYAQNNKGIYIIVDRTYNYLIEVWEFGSFNNTIDFTSEGTLNSDTLPIDFADNYQVIDYNNDEQTLYPIIYNNISVTTDNTKKYIKLASISNNLVRFMELKINLNALTDLYNLILNVRTDASNNPIFSIECNTNSVKTDNIKLGYIKTTNTVDIYLYVAVNWSTITIIGTDFNKPKLEFVDINESDITYENIIYNVEDIKSINNNLIKNKIVCDSINHGVYNVQGNKIYDALGYDINISKRGTTNERPTFDDYSYIGFEYFDTTLNKPIWWNGTSWVEATTDSGGSTDLNGAEVTNVTTVENNVPADATASLIDNKIQFTFKIPKGADGKDGQNGKDGTPVNYKTYVYKQSDTKPSKPTGTELIPSGWSDYPNSTGQWWQCIGTVNGATNQVTEWSEVLPVNGQDGVAQDGKKTEFRFAVNSSSTVAPNLSRTIRNPSGWSIEPPVVGSGQYLWITTAVINPNDTLDGQWSIPVRISGEKGPQGETGPVGPEGPQGPAGTPGAGGPKGQIVYSAGKYDVTKTYVTDANKAPYVLDEEDNNYYILNSQMTWVGTSQGNLRPSNDTTGSWVEIDAYEAIFTKLGIIANGLIGSAVFNGDYVFSQQGINPSSSNATTTNYENFNEDHIYDGTFTPNIMFNFATGAGHLAAGKILFDEEGNCTLNNLYVTGYIQEEYKVVTSAATSIDFSPDVKNYIFTAGNSNFVTIDSANMFKDGETVKEFNIYNGNSSETVNLNTYQWDNTDLNIIESGYDIKHISIKPGRCVKLIIFKDTSTMSSVKTIIANQAEFTYNDDENFGGKGIISKDLA